MKKILIMLCCLILAGGICFGVVKIYPQMKKTNTSFTILTECAENVKTAKNIRYKESMNGRCVLDIAYPTDGGQKMPLFVMVHGGSWISGAKTDMYPLFYTFSERGFVTASIEYDLIDPDGFLLWNPMTIAEQEREVAEAVKYLVEHAEEYQIDPERIVIAGSSSGGQLVGRLAERVADSPDQYPYSFSGVILTAAMTDLTVLVYDDPEMWVENSFIFDGVEGTDVITEVNKVDVLRNVNEKMPPVLLIHGEKDRTVFPVLSRNLFKELTKLGVKAELHMIKDAEHTLLKSEETFYYINEFLQRYI